jgi:hypothetical protein
LPALFPDKSDKDTWKEKTPIWRAWAERFYPALTLAEVISLAQRRGNESAFTLVNNKPYNKPPDADECVYTDSVKGLVTNRYMYRLRSMSTALLPSSNWSPVSIPKSPPKIKPPRAPVFTKIEAGDRQITLHWALNREPDFREYRLYRAEEKDVLEDLRAWGRDDRLVARIPDPRLKIKRSRLDLPPDLPVADIEAVYFAGEFNRKNKSLIQPRVFNYYKKSAAAPDTPSTFNPDTRRIENLRRIAEGTPVIVIYRDTEDSVQVLEYISTAPPYSDIGLLGLHDYYYRLVTLDWTGNVSEGSKIIHTRTLEIEPPPTPRATAERLVTGGVHRIILRIEVEHGLQVMIQRREVGDVFWTIAAPWQDDSSLTVWSENIEPEADMEYQIWSRTPNKKVCEAPLILRPEIPE